MYFTVKMPYKYPDSCSVAADAQLGIGGHLAMQTVAKK
jgi:hypothetical protein